MDRRHFLGLTAASAAGPLLSNLSADRPPNPPNVVMIVSDDQSWTDFGFMGHEHVKTPNIDRLASESAVFPQGYVPTALCRASLATLLTGLHGSQHKICCNDPPEGVDRKKMLAFIEQVPALPHLLKEAGYVSLQTGKFWEGHYQSAGFTHGMTTEGRHGGPGLAIGRETMEPIYDFVGEAGDRPYFLWYAPFLPHRPHDPPPRLLDKYEAAGRPAPTARYWAMIEWFDETVGELLDFIDRQGQTEDTLVLFVVDNGWIQPTGPTPETRGGFGARSKQSPYDMGVRTPILIRWPGLVEPGYSRELASTVDIAPTVLRAAGLSPTPAMPGTDILGRYRGERPSRETVFGEVYTHDARSLESIAANLTHQWLRHRDWKLIHPVNPQNNLNEYLQFEESQLYHLGQDPMEQNDLASQRPDKVEELIALLSDWEYSSLQA